MKKVKVLLVLILLVTFIKAIGNPVFFVKKDSTSKINVDTIQIKNDVLKLCTTPKARNYKNIASLNEAGNYIKQEFTKIGLEVSEQVFSVYGKEYKNIIAYYGPENGERIVIGAHYDVCGEQQGADDNASGVAGLLEIARQFQVHKPKTHYRFEFVAYTLEEPPFFRTEYMGSYVHAKSLKDKGIKVKAMISLEMIGYFSEEKKSQEYPLSILKLFYPSKANYIAVVGKFGKGKITRVVKKGLRKGSDIKVKSINAPASVQGIDFSDHLNYWEHGFDAVMVTDTSFFRNKNYHQVTDTPETLNYYKMAEVIKGVTYALFNLE
ncbi:M28 family peptidase [Pseudofulvibacter geojedonensis]|uniref:M28 family peptidase n=1 Tax=Pseudofulvibacter geojedonensis TaxID=1123758 RepID=A0ABW3I463_9FLAO